MSSTVTANSTNGSQPISRQPSCHGIDARNYSESASTNNADSAGIEIQEFNASLNAKLDSMTFNEKDVGVSEYFPKTPESYVNDVSNRVAYDRLSPGLGHPGPYIEKESYSNKILENRGNRGNGEYINTRSGVSLERVTEGGYGREGNSYPNDGSSNYQGNDNYIPRLRASSNVSDSEGYRMGSRPRLDSMYSIDEENHTFTDRDFEKEALQIAAMKPVFKSPRPVSGVGKDFESLYYIILLMTNYHLVIKRRNEDTPN
jgi:hypothetical protein